LADDDRCGSEADVPLLNFDVRFTPESGHIAERDWNVRLGPEADEIHGDPGKNAG